MDARLAQLQASDLAGYLDAVEAIAAGLADGVALEIGLEDIERICRVFTPQSLDHKDLRILQARVLDVLFMQRERIGHQLMVGLATYTLGLLEGVQDGSGFESVGGVLEATAAEQVRHIVQQLGDALPDARDLFEQYGDVLERVCAAQVVAQRIISQVGNRGLEPLCRLVHGVDEAHRGRILGALSGFAGDPEVRQFFDDYIAFYQRVAAAERGDPDVSTTCRLRVAEARECYPGGTDSAIC